MALQLTEEDIDAISEALAKVTPVVTGWVPLELGAKQIGYVDSATGEPTANQLEQIRVWGQKREFLLPGKEVRKFGRLWQLNARRINERFEREGLFYSRACCKINDKR